MKSSVDDCYKKPKMRDIARDAGVSLGTVSRVMNGNSEVAPELVERVLSTARQLGYRGPHGSACPDLGTIGYLIDIDMYGGIMSDPFQQHFLWGVEQATRARGGHVVFASCWDDIQTGGLPSIVERKLVQGVILKARITTPESWIHQLQAAVPTVLLMHRTTDHAVPSVMCDNHAAMHQALAHLKALGHRRVGFLSEDDREWTTPHHLERQEAFTRLQRMFGLAQHPGYIQTPCRAEGETFEDVIERGLENFLALGPERPTAIVGAADIYALALLKPLAARGLRVPEDMSVIGVMNTAPSGLSVPALTTISLAEENLGQAAVELLQKRIGLPGEPAEHLVLGTRLVERQSCASPHTK